MTIGRSRHNPSGTQRRRKRTGLRADHAKKRQLLLESLEARQLLAVGPRLAGIQPNNSDIFSFASVATNVRDVAPRELTVRFDETQQIDSASLAGIRITRSGFDGVFGNGNDALIAPGFIGVEKSPGENEVVIRFAESLLVVRTVVDHGAVSRPTEAVVDFAHLGERYGQQRFERQSVCRLSCARTLRAGDT